MAATLLLWGGKAFAPRNSAALGGVLDPALTKAALIQRLCLGVGEALGQEPAVVLCDPTLAPALTYFTGQRSVASLYWENAAGVAAAAAVLGGWEDEEVRAEVARRGWTHVLIAEDQEVDASFCWVAHGTRDPAVVRRTLAHRLMHRPGSLPYWIELDAVATARLRRPVSAGGGTLTNRFLLYRLRP